MHAWSVAIIATGVLGGLAGCGSGRPADQQETCSVAINDAVNGDGATVSTSVTLANVNRAGTEHVQAMVNARAAATAWQYTLTQQTQREVSPELRQVLNDGVKMVGDILVTLDNDLSVPAQADSVIKRHAEKIQQACKDAYS